MNERQHAPQHCGTCETSCGVLPLTLSWAADYGPCAVKLQTSQLMRVRFASHEHGVQLVLYGYTDSIITDTWY